MENYFLLGKERLLVFFGISLALPMNRNWIGKYRQRQMPIDGRKGGKEMKKRQSVKLTVQDVIIRIAIGTVFVFTAGFNYLLPRG